ncbi:hypothetical protein KR222_006012, partial [Zaprionus bogoriensis]
MHSAELPGIAALRPMSSIPVIPPIEPCFNFTPSQMELQLKDPSIARLVANRTAEKEFFYGIEVTAHTNFRTTCMDFNWFLPFLPTFISVVWITSYSEALQNSTMDEVASIKFIASLKSHIPAMPHLSLYHLSKQQIDEFFALNLNNVLIIRGDKMHAGQAYNYTYQAIEHARRLRGGELTIAVGGYPEGYTSLDDGSQDMAEVTRFLKHKIDVGGDFVCTQVCYSLESILTFLRNARKAGIEAPIMLGVMVPCSFKNYKKTVAFSKIALPPELLCELDKVKHSVDKTEQFFIDLTVDIIEKVVKADLGVYGVQFYTLNRFGSVIKVLCELRRRGILK